MDEFENDYGSFQWFYHVKVSSIILLPFEVTIFVTKLHPSDQVIQLIERNILVANLKYCIGNY